MESSGRRVVKRCSIQDGKALTSMRKSTVVNYVIDTAALLVVLTLLCTGLFVRWVLPPGSGGHDGGPKLVLWGMGRHGWGDVHFWLAIVAVGLLGIHVAVHWTWIWYSTLRLLPERHRRSMSTNEWAKSMCAVGFIFLLAFVVIGSYLTAQSNRRTLPGSKTPHVERMEESIHSGPAQERTSGIGM
jgi:hypothetical protein